MRRGLGLGLRSFTLSGCMKTYNENAVGPRHAFFSTVRTWQRMAENSLRNRRRERSPGNRHSPTLPSPELKEEEEVVWGKTPGGEGRLYSFTTIINVAD